MGKAFGSSYDGIIKESEKATISLSSLFAATGATVLGNLTCAGGRSKSREYVYYFDPGVGDTDNALFIITQKEGAVEAHIDFVEAAVAGTYSIRVSAEDQGVQAANDAVFTITVAADITNLTCSNLTITAPATAVGTLSTTGGRAPYVYTKTTGTGDTNNALFTITGAALAFTDASSAGSYSVRVLVTDANGDTYAKAFTVTVGS